MRNFLLKFIFFSFNIHTSINLSLNDIFLEKEFKYFNFKDISSIRYIKGDLLILSGVKTIFDKKYSYINIYSLNTLFGYSSKNNSIFNLEIDISFKIANIFLFSINFFNFIKKIYISVNYTYKRFDIGLIKNIYSNELKKIESVQYKEKINNTQYKEKTEINKIVKEEPKNIELNKNLVLKLKEEPNFLLSNECMTIYKKCLTKIYNSFEDKQKLLEVKFLLNLIELKANIISMNEFDIIKLINELNSFHKNYKLDLNKTKFFNSIHLKNIYNFNEDFRSDLCMSFNSRYYMSQTFCALVIKFYNYIKVNFGITSDNTRDINCNILNIFNIQNYKNIYEVFNKIQDKDNLIQKNFEQLFIENLFCDYRETNLLKENHSNFDNSEIILKLYLALELDLKNEISDFLNSEKASKIIRRIFQSVYLKLNLTFNDKIVNYNNLIELYQKENELVIEKLIAFSKEYKMYNCYYSEKSELNCKSLLNQFSSLLKSNSNSFANNYNSFKAKFESFKNEYKSNKKIKFIEYIKSKYIEHEESVLSFETRVFNKSENSGTCINLISSSINDIETSLNSFLQYSKRAAESYTNLLTYIENYKTEISIEKYTQSCLLKIVQLLKQYKLIFQKNMYNLCYEKNDSLETYLTKDNINSEEEKYYYKLAYSLLENNDFYKTNPFIANFIKHPDYILKQCNLFIADYNLNAAEWQDFYENNNFDVLSLFLYLKDQLQLKINSNIIFEESKKIGFYSMFSKKNIACKKLFEIVFKNNSLKGILSLPKKIKDHSIIDLDNTLDKTEKSFWEYVNYNFIDFSYTKTILEILKRSLDFNSTFFVKDFNKFIESLNDDIKKFSSSNDIKMNKLIENLKITHINMIKKLEVYIKDIRIYIKYNKGSNDLIEDESEDDLKNKLEKKLEDDFLSSEEEGKKEGVLSLINEKEEEEFNERFIIPINIVRSLICLPISEETSIIAPFLNSTDKVKY